MSVIDHLVPFINSPIYLVCVAKVWLTFQVRQEAVRAIIAVSTKSQITSLLKTLLSSITSKEAEQNLIHSTLMLLEQLFSADDVSKTDEG